MHVSELGEVVARREFDVSADNGSQPGVVTVKIGKPVDLERGASYCPYQIVGMGGKTIRYATGVDSVQALILPLVKIGTDLYISPEFKSGRISLMCDKSDNLGLPLISEAFGNVVPNPAMTLIL